MELPLGFVAQEEYQRSACKLKKAFLGISYWLSM
jgi:hypothetical protein